MKYDFQMSGKYFRTDKEGLDMVKKSIEIATDEHGVINPEGVGYVMELGLLTGKIVEITEEDAKECRL